MLLSMVLVGCSPDAEQNGPGPAGPVRLTDPSWRLQERFHSLVLVSWTQDGPASVHVEYSVDPDVWQSTPTVEYAAGTHERTIAGIPYDHDAEWRVVATGTLPRSVPRPTVTVSDPTRWTPDSDFFLVSINERDGGWTGGTYWTLVLDRAGRIVWANKTPDNHWTLFATVARSGDHLIWDESTYWAQFDEGRGGILHRAWLDQQFEAIPAPGLHHAFVELPDTTLVWGSKAHGGKEALVEKGPGQRDETVLWTCQNDWPGSSNGYGQCESNGLFYVEQTNSYLYSFYTNNSIVEVDRDTGESKWWAGDVAGGYQFEPRNSEYTWQHGISYTDTGSLLVSSEWDGGDGGPQHTWVLAETNGQAWRLSNGNTLHVVGSASVIREVDTPSGDDVWRVEFESDRLLGKGEFIPSLYALLKPTE
jgi:hypothetical protein